MRIVAIAGLFWALFSFNIELAPFNATLFSNDFMEEGVAAWLFYELTIYTFLILIGGVGAANCTKPFIKRVFRALVLDGVISIFRFIVFGYYEPSFIAPLCNALPLSYIIYSYFVYGKLD